MEVVEESLSSVLIEERPDARTCRHVEVEQLGHDGSADFFRCVACGSIVIAKGPHRWIIRPTDAAGPLPF